MEDDTRGTNSEESPILYDTPLAVAENFIIHKGSGIRRPVTQHILKFPFFVPADGDGTVRHINTGVDSFYRTVDRIAFHEAANDILTKLQRNDLPEMKDILDDVQ